MHHLVVLSDLHLWQATDHDDLWMRYRHRRFLPDAHIAELLSILCAQVRDGELELVCNGDIFDFDIPAVSAGHAKAGPSPRTEAEAVARLARILDDHEVFLRALAKLIGHGHRVIFIAGNHDLQMLFPGVRTLLVERLSTACRREPCGASPEQVAAQVAFYPWFYRTKNGVHIEHGNQYDPYCSVSDPLWPFRIDGSLQTNIGTLVIEHLGGKLGYFNPNVESSFLLTTREYLDHWVRFYLRTPRSLVKTWFLGSLRVAWHILREYGLCGPRQRMVELQTAEEAAHTTLFAQSNLRGIVHLLGADRALLLLCAVMTLLLFMLWVPLGVLGVLFTGAVYQALRLPAPADLASVSEQVARSARMIARIYGARAVVFGHTHDPSGRWEGGVFYGNSGTWVPMYRDIECSIPIEESRPFIWLRQESGRLEGGLYRFHDGRLHLAPAQGRAAETSARGPVFTRPIELSPAVRAHFRGARRRREHRVHREPLA